MAKASLVRRVVREPKSRRRVVLELTEGEADFLVNQCHRVRGDARLSPVKYAVRIRTALQRALGYSWENCDARVLSRGTVRFATYDQLVSRKISELKEEAQAAMAGSWDTQVLDVEAPIHHYPNVNLVAPLSVEEFELKAVPTFGSVAAQAASGLWEILRGRFG